MARVKEIHVSVGRTVGLPNYGSIRFDDAEVVELEPGDDPNQVYADAYARVAGRLSAKLQQMGVK
ncbi:hypothetical protein [Azospirillum sp. Sh1]|uniref:hypothetical protein n=1 Tax=Azospirillum sp. Sh1 TaxID=2607285 RepID=UPI0011ED8E56|nr:hypothetical protein [Azospirillum sp. Sh1]KAA0573434.1 hypothetical protein FZ029_20870 [Azospirillum sp. Sh1]